MNMQSFEYRVVPAPRRGEKVKGAKTSEDRFAVALMRVMNTLGAEGWEYVRADTLPCDERTGLTGVKTSYLNMLVFRRPRQTGATLTVDDTAIQCAACSERYRRVPCCPVRWGARCPIWGCASTWACASGSGGGIVSLRPSVRLEVFLPRCPWRRVCQG